MVVQHIQKVDTEEAVRILGDTYQNGLAFLKEETLGWFITIPGAQYQVDKVTVTTLGRKEFIYFDKERNAWLPTAKCCAECA